MEFLEVSTWLKIINVIIIDIMLAGDNAVVIGMAASKLATDLQKKAILWGTAGAILLRVLFAFVLVEALNYIPDLHIIGGVVLLWIAVQLLMGDEEDTNVEAKDALMPAILTIVMADAMMSIDNVIGVVGAAQGHLELIIVGLLITVPLVVFGAKIFATYINRYPIILYIGGALLGWVAGGMIVADPIIAPYIAGLEDWVKVAAVALVMVVVSILKWRRRIG